MNNKSICLKCQECGEVKDAFKSDARFKNDSRLLCGIQLENYFTQNDSVNENDFNESQILIDASDFILPKECPYYLEQLLLAQ